MGYGLVSVRHQFFHNDVEKTYRVFLTVYDYSRQDPTVDTGQTTMTVRNVFTVTINGKPGGTVSASGGMMNGLQGDGIQKCATDSAAEACRETYLQGTSVSLMATPYMGWWFAGWLDHEKHLVIEEQELPLIIAENRTLEPIFLSVNAITVYQPICQAQTDVWNEACRLRWEDVILFGEPVRVKVALTSEIPTLAQQAAINAFSKILEMSVFSDPAQAVWQTSRKTLAQYLEQIVTVNGISEFRLTIPWHQVESWKLLPARQQDNDLEFTSVDIITKDRNVETSESNHDDGDAFDRLMENPLGFSRRGKARRSDLTQDKHGNPTIPYNGKEEEYISVVNSNFMKAAGVQFLQFRIQGKNGMVLSLNRHIQNQADYFYYSGHGNHDSGGLAGGQLTPNTVKNFWQSQDIETVIFAGCSVLDINDYGLEWLTKKKCPACREKSPGVEWIKTGPRYFLGYRYTAPRDTQGADELIKRWVRSKGKTVDDWMKINLERVNHVRPGLNACAINLQTMEYKYLCRPDDDSDYTICIAKYDLQNKKWPRILRYSRKQFHESVTHDGTVDNVTSNRSVIITLSGDHLTGNDGEDFVVAGKVRVNIPESLQDYLTVKMLRDNEWQLKVQIDGTVPDEIKVPFPAIEYTYAVEVAFQDAAFISGNAADVEEHNTGISITFER